MFAVLPRCIQVLEQLGFRKGPKSINRSHIVVAKGGKILDVQYGISPKASIKDAVEFCLTNKGEAVAAGEEAEQAAGDEAEQAAGDAEQTAAAEQAEEAAAAAPEEPKAEELKAEDETAPEPEGGAADAVADGDAADETAPADDAAAMEVDAAAEVEEPKEAEEEKVGLLSQQVAEWLGSGALQSPSLFKSPACWARVLDCLAGFNVSSGTVIYRTLLLFQLRDRTETCQQPWQQQPLASPADLINVSH